MFMQKIFPAALLEALDKIKSDFLTVITSQRPFNFTGLESIT